MKAVLIKKNRMLLCISKWFPLPSPSQKHMRIFVLYSPWESRQIPGSWFWKLIMDKWIPYPHWASGSLSISLPVFLHGYWFLRWFLLWVFPQVSHVSLYSSVSPVLGAMVYCVFSSLKDPRRVDFSLFSLLFVIKVTSRYLTCKPNTRNI